jgi:hypothetical protein
VDRPDEIIPHGLAVEIDQVVGMSEQRFLFLIGFPVGTPVWLQDPIVAREIGV